MTFILFLKPNSPLAPPTEGEFNELEYCTTRDTKNLLAPPPNLHQFIRLEYVGAHEAAFVIAGFPKENLILVNPSLPVEFQKHRFAFYAPPGVSKFNPSEYGVKFKEIFEKLEEAAQWKTVNVSHTPLFEGVSWLINPSEAIIWALKQGIYIAEDLQKVIGVFLIDAELKKPRINRIKNLSVAQYLLFRFMDKPFGIKDLSKDPLFTKHGTGNNNEHPSAIMKQIKEHLVEPGKAWKQRSPYVPRPISELKQIDNEGKIRFHFLSLMIALETFMNIWIEEMGRGDLVKGVDSCLTSFHDPILDGFLDLKLVKLYLDDAPALIWRLALEHCDDIWATFLPISSHPVTEYPRKERPWNVERKCKIIA